MRDLLVRLARSGLVGARWTDMIQDEWIRNLLNNRPDLSARSLKRTQALLDEAVPGALVEGFERHIPELHLPDPHDRHVLAAAIEADADVIITLNVKDFPTPAVSRYGIDVQLPDEFLRRLLDRDPEGVYAVARAQRAALRQPPLSVGRYLDNLRTAGLHRTAEHLQGVADEL
jgi:hypothetical protein